jgi:curved DNA-binding protein CbpA
METEFDPKVDYYAILGVDDNATTADIKKAHRARIAQIHPDRGGEAARAAAVNVARDVLSRPNARRAYDLARRQWFIQALESPIMRACFDPDGQIAAHFAAHLGAAHATTQGPAGAAPQNDPAGASAQRAASWPDGTARPQAPAPGPRRRPTAGFSRVHDRYAEQRARAVSHAAAEGPLPDGQASPSPTESSESSWFHWGELTESVWRDACKTLDSGDWLGAAGMLGAALFLDRLIYTNADDAARAKTDAVVAAGNQERAKAFTETITRAVKAHFGLDRTEAAARAGAAAHKGASTTSRATAARRPGKRNTQGASHRRLSHR